MKYFCICIILSLRLLIFSTAWGDEAISVHNEQWYQWRGPEATGVARNAEVPIQWDEKTNVKWKVEIPGKGHATPIIWENLVFILTAVKTEEQVETQEEKPVERRRGPPSTKSGSVLDFKVIALNREDGTIAWQKTVCSEKPHEGTHADATWASNSPITDGERLYAYFGSRGLYCLDLMGNLIWDIDLGNMSIRRSFGEGISPVLCNDKVIVNWDHEGESFIVALNKLTGKEIWKIPRDEATSWGTPIVTEVQGKLQIIVSASTRIRAYEPETGNVIWECGGMTQNVVPSPVVSGEILYAMSGFRGNSLLCINIAHAKGDITDSGEILWSYNANTPYVPSPLLYDNTLYFLKTNNEKLTCLNIKTGEAYYSAQDLEGLKGVYSSPVGAAGRVYITGRNGVTIVLEQGPEYKIFATNKLDDRFASSAALGDKEIFLRGYKSLYCISK